METLIQRQVLAAAAATVAFTGIPQTYEDLEFVVMGRLTDVSTNEAVVMQINGDSGANYDYARIYGNNGGSGGSGVVGGTSFQVGYLSGAASPAGEASSLHLLIPAYARTVLQKTFISDNAYFGDNTAGNQLRMSFTGRWRSTAAVNSLLLLDTGAGSFDVGTVLSLYGRV